MIAGAMAISSVNLWLAPLCEMHPSPLAPLLAKYYRCSRSRGTLNGKANSNMRENLNQPFNYGIFFIWGAIGHR
jgi:hypothetical protein